MNAGLYVPFNTVGHFTPKEVRHLFHWYPEDIAQSTPFAFVVRRPNDLRLFAHLPFHGILATMNCLWPNHRCVLQCYLVKYSSIFQMPVVSILLCSSSRTNRPTAMTCKSAAYSSLFVLRFSAYSSIDLLCVSFWFVFPCSPQRWARVSSRNHSHYTLKDLYEHQKNMETLTKAYIALNFNNKYQNYIPSDKVRLWQVALAHFTISASLGWVTNFGIWWQLFIIK